jgi:asparagine synthase (glutamine-hydrolysing)
MSAIAAILAREGPLDPSGIHDIIRTMIARGPDSRAVWQNGSAALGHAGLFTLPTDTEPQPVHDPASGCALVFDGRIDARADLAVSCDIDGPTLERMSDAALVLHAFLARGTGVFTSLLGDFAFALWDGPRARLICGRDVLGLRPLFYTSTERALVVASELQAVLRRRPGKPNVAMVAEALTGVATSRDETLFDGVFRVPPGHLLVANRERSHVTEFVRLEAPAPLVYRDEREYFTHFRDVFQLAVRDRVRARGKTAVMLSGGLDSSTVYAAARAESDVDGYTVGYDDPALDETPIARATVALNGGRHYRVGLSAASYDYLDEIVRFRDLPTNPSGGNSGALRKEAAERGVNVFLSGLGGDELFLGHSGRWTDWLCSGEWPLLWRELKTWRYSSDNVPWTVLTRKMIAPLVPAPLRKVIAATKRPRAFAWVSRSLLREAAIFDRIGRTPEESGMTHAVTGMMRGIVDAAAISAWEEQERLAARFQQDDRMPYFDRRVISFALALPEKLRSRPGSPKDFTRRAWNGEIPAGVINTLHTPDCTFQVVDALRSLGAPARFDTLAITELGWVERSAIASMCKELFAPAGAPADVMHYAWTLWAVLTVDEWYRRALH